MSKKSSTEAKQTSSASALKREAENAKKKEAERIMARDARVKGMTGRPTKYRKEFCRELIQYFLEYEPYRTEFTMFGPKEIPSDLPTLAGFAMNIGVHRDTLHEWSESKDKSGKPKHPEFSDAIKKAKTIQEHYLLTDGLRGNYDRTFAIFSAKNNLPYKDESVIEHQGLTYGELDRAGAAQKASTPDEARRMVEEEEWE